MVTSSDKQTQEACVETASTAVKIWQPGRSIVLERGLRHEAFQSFKIFVTKTQSTGFLQWLGTDQTDVHSGTYRHSLGEGQADFLRWTH